MNTPDITLEIQTLGRFNIYAAGKAVTAAWPSEEIKVLFCSLLSPLDLYFSWDRVCRSMLGVPATKNSRQQLDEYFILPLEKFVTRIFGFNPVIKGPEGIRIDHQRIHVDAQTFQSTIVEGLRLMSVGECDVAREKFSAADSLYGGSYLPGVPGKIIANTRNELESLYRTVIVEAGRSHVKGLLI
ncbi:MAG: hypothetical protein RW306_15520 [Geobacteraceae bacterium]|nr:hypothetical protein [Geobacteraceae bacterium]